MIELTRSHEYSGGGVIRVVGVGSAGSRAVDRLCREGVAGVELFVANTDARALAASLTPNKITLGRSLTRGLGAGGDPEVGRSAAQESAAELVGKLSGASLVIVVAGLGGGTGSGAAPEIAALAQSQGALVLVVATLPFQFEGRRRKDQAFEALDALRRSTNLVVCFDNQRMSMIVGPAAGIEDAFEVVDALLAQVIRSLSALIRRRSVLNSGLDEVAATVVGARSTALFGFGVADGEGRAEGALARALQSALLDKGHRLADADRLWVHVAGGEDMRWSEVQAIMTRASAQVSDQVRIFCGAAIDASLAGTVSVTILAGVPDSVFAREPIEGSRGLARTYEQNPLPVTSDQTVTEVRTEGQVLSAPPVSELSVSHVISADPVPAAETHEPVSGESENSASSELSFPLVSAQESKPEVAAEANEPEFESPQGSYEDPQQFEPDSIHSEPVTRGNDHRVMENDGVSTPHVSNERRVPETHSARSLGAEVSGGSLNVAVGGGAVENIRREPRNSNVTAPPVSDQESDIALKKKQTVQEQMKFEQVNRGRFEKTDPTIVDGEDLDVPTFLRRRKDV